MTGSGSLDGLVFDYSKRIWRLQPFTTETARLSTKMQQTTPPPPSRCEISIVDEGILGWKTNYCFHLACVAHSIPQMWNNSVLHSHCYIFKTALTTHANLPGLAMLRLEDPVMLRMYLSPCGSLGKRRRRQLESAKYRDSTRVIRHGLLQGIVPCVVVCFL